MTYEKIERKKNISDVSLHPASVTGTKGFIVSPLFFIISPYCANHHSIVFAVSLLYLTGVYIDFCRAQKKYVI